VICFGWRASGTSKVLSPSGAPAFYRTDGRTTSWLKAKNPAHMQTGTSSSTSVRLRDREAVRRDVPISCWSKTGAKTP
jgi:hypothetical protein